MGGRPLKPYNPQYRFFFGTKGVKKKLGKKETPFFMGSAQTRSLFEKSETKSCLLGYIESVILLYTSTKVNLNFTFSNFHKKISAEVYSSEIFY